MVFIYLKDIHIGSFSLLAHYVVSQDLYHPTPSSPVLYVSRFLRICVIDIMRGRTSVLTHLTNPPYEPVICPLDHRALNCT